jgi:hypothetical protein
MWKKHIYIRAKNGKLGTLYFAHSETVRPLLALLGLYNDSKTPTADNYAEQKNRQNTCIKSGHFALTNVLCLYRSYRTSIISSMSANLAFVLYDCEGGDDGGVVQKLLTLHQEKPVIPAGCDEELCDWNQFQNAYQVEKLC